MSLEDYNAKLMNPILDYFEKEASERPRINCPRHGDQLICSKCRKCLRCYKEEEAAENVAHCKKESHTFLNLSAPCYFCRRRGFPNHITNSYCLCGSCYFFASLEHAKRIKR